MQPLHYAIENNRLDLVEWLVREAHCEPTARAEWTMVTTACGYGHSSVTKQEISRPPMHLARSPEMVRLLVRLGCDVNAKDDTGDTALAKLYSLVRMSSACHSHLPPRARVSLLTSSE